MKVLTQARRTAIVEAANQLFQEFGYEGASMSELAQRLKGSKATLYRYFPSKEALFDAVVRTSTTSHLSKAAADLIAQGEENVPLATCLVQFGETMLGVMTDSASALAIYRMVVAEAGRSEVGELFYKAGPQECIKALARLIKKAMDRKELRHADPELMAQYFLSLVTAESEVRIYQHHPAPLSSQQIRNMVDRAVQMFLGGAANHFAI